MYEIDFLPVGTSNGDAICIRYGDPQRGYYLHVIDGGFTDTAQTIINHIGTHYGWHYRINHMMLSHADNDHATGLIGVMEHFKVDQLWMNRPWLYAAQVLPHFHGNYTLNGLIQRMRDMHPYLVRLEQLALAQGTTIHEAFQGDAIGPFIILAPSRARYIHLIPDLDKTPTSHRGTEVGLLFKGLIEATKTWVDEHWHYETLSNNPEPTSASNETSIVQHAVIDGRSILLTADAGPEALNEAADFAEFIGSLKAPNFVQVPHHGSRRNVTPAVLDRWLGQRMNEGAIYGTAFCSVGSDQPDYPRGQVKNAFQRRGYPVHTTRDRSKTHYFGREPRADWYQSIPEPFATKVDL